MLLKYYPIFHIFMLKKTLKKILSLLGSVHTKKLINMKVRKKS